MMAKGRLHVVGFGPGGKDDMTFRAARVIENADIVTGYTAYVNLMKKVFPDKEFKATGMMKEVERCRMAIEDAMSGKDVAMISSGDSGIYGMAGIIYQLAEEMGADIEIDCVPGITAAASSASILGAPLMHDFAIISLSDLMTPLDLIMKRVDRAADADMIIALYNPKSRHRPDYIFEIQKILLQHRSPDTPVGIVTSASRAKEQAVLSDLGHFTEEEIGMFSMVIIGNSNTYVQDGYMITPRGYKIAGK